MQRRDGTVLYSASDLINFLECDHLTSLDLIHLETPLQKKATSEEDQLIHEHGFRHEKAYLERLKASHARVVDLSGQDSTIDVKAAATMEAMRSGADVIFQATLRTDCFIGYADFLRRVEQPSALGDWSYEVVDTKLARTARAKFLVQLAYYSALLADAQGGAPRSMHVVLGDRREISYRCADYARYLETVKQRFLERVRSTEVVTTYPDPCDKCAQCVWDDLCTARRLQDDHLSQVANITRVQTRKLEAAGVRTLVDLASLPTETPVARIVPDTLARLRHQASLQLQARQTGQRLAVTLPVQLERQSGFLRMPQPAEGDLFFDMEGDPLEEGGLEYLFGLYLFEDGKPRFIPFWAHNRAEEKVAFEQFMDFVTAWLRDHPGAYIYHYAAYEQTALKRLMSLHGTREADVDNLLRTHKLVDLYKVVREGIRVSEPRYSIKNIEHFYLEGRTGDVTNAGASIVWFERWKETGDPKLLQDIEDYNRDDVRSTFELRQWLLTLRPHGLPWFSGSDEGDRETPGAGGLSPAEARLVPYREKLVDALPTETETWGPQEHLSQLTYQLLDFHRRAAKPEWWALFARMDMSDEELLDDGECLGGLEPDPECPPAREKRSIRYTFLYPEQDTKLRTAASATFVRNGAPVSKLVVNEETLRVSFTLNANRELPPLPLALGPGQPVDQKDLVSAVFRFADSLVAGEPRYPAMEGFLQQLAPVVRDHEAGQPLIPIGADKPLPHIIDVVSRLEQSCIFVQGPPGAGKTYTGSHVIVALLRQGKRVGVSSNSHKAVNNLLKGVEEVAKESGFTFRGAKKSTKDKRDSFFDGDMIEDVFDNDEITGNLDGPFPYQLMAGTAWLFADPALDQQLDYLFVDEAGQVAVANLVAMGTSARNIVLLGDQMQLGQPIQGVHPGRSGESALEYLLDGVATIAPDRGIFLAHTWRMHPHICRFISDAVYDGRLESEPGTRNQSLLLDATAHPMLKPTGIVFLPVQHEGCSQRSEVEAALVRDLYSSLLRQRYRDQNGREHLMTAENILVVAPYNMQVNLLKETLPEGARVGTVDKFQGQEAEVVIVSMATSSGDDLPRDIGFLYSKNRLNVAISRARCLALLIANPALTSIRCKTPEDMALVNTLCWVREYAQCS
ncbi:MAG: TM0106 family RecB-like putative nuclease [Oxalobacteraceae bacterium]|nr:TM0106 family RecB-like putative nuclease [Oxalobacteraceae bacterium]